MSSYAFHPEAVADLDEIWEYIAEDNIDAADGLLADIYSTLTTLAASPHLGHRRPDLTARALRFHVVRNEYLWWNVIGFGFGRFRKTVSAPRPCSCLWRASRLSPTAVSAATGGAVA